MIDDTTFVILAMFVISSGWFIAGMNAATRIWEGIWDRRIGELKKKQFVSSEVPAKSQALHLPQELEVPKPPQAPPDYKRLYQELYERALRQPVYQEPIQQPIVQQPAAQPPVKPQFILPEKQDAAQEMLWCKSCRLKVPAVDVTEEQVLTNAGKLYGRKNFTCSQCGLKQAQLTGMIKSEQRDS